MKHARKAGVFEGGAAVPAAIRQGAVSLALVAALALAAALSVAPGLHERLHRHAGEPQHECAITLVGSGSFEHATPPASLNLAPPKDVPILFTSGRSWVPPVFAEARIFEHAPPAAP